MTDNLKNSFDKFANQISKEFKTLKQNIKSGYQQKTVVLNFNDDEKQKTSYQKEIELMQKNIESVLKFKKTENEIKQNILNPEKQQSAIAILNAYQEADNLSDKVADQTKNISNSFANAIEKLINGTEDFDTVVKQMLVDIQQSLFQMISNAVLNKIISSTAEQQALSAISNLTDYSGNSVSTGLNITFGLLKNLFGSHHSGGLVPQGTGNFALPNTKEYLSVLKGGERVLSPAENSSFENNHNQKNFVINNFNVKAWDSKDIRKYLLDNKDILAGISVENIKYNNSNLRQTILGV